MNKKYFYEYIRDIEYKRSWIEKNLTDLQSRILSQLYKKDFAKIFAEEFNFKVSETYIDGVSLVDAIHWIATTNIKSFFLKPLGGRGNRGCYPLQKEGSQLNVVGESRSFTLNDLYLVAKQILEKNKYADQWIIEELILSDDMPNKVGEDIKFYMFYGSVGLILQRGMEFSLLKEERKFKWYDENQKNIDVGKYTDIIDVNLSLNLSEKIIQNVKALSKKIPYPFFRIDYLIGNGGNLYLNEFTPGPGDPEGFNEVISIKLAKMFKDARDRLEEDITNNNFNIYEKNYLNILRRYSELIGKRTNSDQYCASLNSFEILPFPDFEREILKYMTEGYIPKGRDLPGFNIEVPIEWDADPFHDRNWKFQLHSLRMLDPWFNKLDKMPFEREKDIIFIHEIIKDWFEKSELISNRKSYAWYDMSVGLRALKISYFVSFLLKYKYNFDYNFYYDLAKVHIKNLTNILNLNKGNHGLFQLHGLMSLLWVYPSLREYNDAYIFAKKQMCELIFAQLGNYGIHTENSPDYHFFAINKIENIIKAPWWKEIDINEVTEKLHRAKIASVWFVDPLGKCAPIGDSTSGTRLIKNFDNLFLWDHKINQNYMGAILDGYVVIRTVPSVPASLSSYLFFTASFHSQTHKHSDCLSFIWQEDGCDILIDSGKYGYKGGEVREYFLSSRAHNTIEINGASSFRNNEYAYGSGVEKLQTLPNGGWLISAGTEGVHDNIKHRRNMVYVPKKYLLVIDHIENFGDEHKDITTWWHFDDSYLVEIVGNDEFRVIKNGKVVVLGSNYSSSISSTSYHIGEETPRLQGWVSSGYLEKKPAPVLGIHSIGVSKKLLRCTLFQYNEENVRVNVYYSKEIDNWLVSCTDLKLDYQYVLKGETGDLFYSS